jgi:filamentous hemagglutinin
VFIETATGRVALAINFSFGEAIATSAVNFGLSWAELGYRYVDGFGNDETEYTALMNAGVTFARQYGLSVGVALNAAQMAQLTSDIVWLVELTVTLPDGCAQQVLVPQVYVRVRPGDIDGSGALLAGDSVNLQTKGGVVNSGTIAGRTAVKIDAGTFDNLGGRISGGNVALITTGNLNIIGGTMDARDALTIHAGGDLDVRSTTRSNSGGIGGVSTNQDKIAGLYVTNPNGGTLIASAGNNFTLDGSTVRNAGSGATTLTAGNNLHLGTVKVGTSMLGLSQRSRTTVKTAGEVGSTVSGGGKVTLAAGNNITARQANVSAAGSLDVKAGSNITIESGRSTSDMTCAANWTDKGLLKKTDNQVKASGSSDTAVGSSFTAGKNATFTAGNDFTVIGGYMAAQDKLSI